MSIFHAFVSSYTSILTGVIIIETVIIVIMLFRYIQLFTHLKRAEKFAEDSARAAALAVPGGIDSEVVLKLLKNGKPVTLDTVFEAMEKQERLQQNQ